jgi:hypothetical protein
MHRGAVVFLAAAVVLFRHRDLNSLQETRFFMEIATFWLGVSQTAAALIAAGLAFWLARIALMQLQEALKTRQDSQRPQLIPVFHVLVAGSQGYDSNASSMTLKVKNVGPGLAFNVRAVLLPPGTNPDRPGDSDPNWHSAKSNLPWEPGVEQELMFGKGGLEVYGTDQIGGQPLAPPHPLVYAGQNQPHAITRLTITCCDIFDRKHATMLDWAVTGPWNPIMIDTLVTTDLMDLSNAHVAARRGVVGG